MLHKEHGKYMQDLEEQAMGEESRSHNDFLFVRSSCTAVHHCLKALWQPHTTSYLGKHLHHLYLAHHRGPSAWKNNQLLLFHPHWHPNYLLGPKDDTLCQIPWRACL